MSSQNSLPKAPYAKCHDCPLRNKAFVPTYVPTKGDIAVIGEAPGYNETLKGQPFVGQSGRLLKLALHREGVDYDEVWRGNVVACRPPNNRTPTKLEVACCAPRLIVELEDFGGNTVVPVGQTAGEFMLELGGYDPDIKVSERRGHWFAWFGKRIMPTWHPAYILYRPGKAKEFYLDIKRAVCGTPDHPLQQQPFTRFIDTPVDLMEALSEVPEGAIVSFDLETDQIMWYDRPGVEADDILMLGIAWKQDEAIIVHPDLLYSEPGNLPLTNMSHNLLQEFFDREDITFVAHNGKFDALFLRTAGLRVRVDFDTMLAHYALWELAGTHSLKSLALEYYGLADYEQDLVQKHLKSRNDYYSKVPYPELGIYCAWDNVVTRELYFDLTEEMKRDNVYDTPFKLIFMPLQQVFTDMEWRGVPIDIDHVNKWEERLFTYCDDIEEEMQRIADSPLLNPRSYIQVGNVIYNERGLPRPRGRGIKPNSTAKKALAHIKPGQDEFVDALRKYRRVHKMNRSYLKNLRIYVDLKGRVHPSALIHGTEVGRLSFRNPAIQTIPRPYEDMFGAIVRSAFVAPPGWKFIIADYSQAELRVAAILSGDPFLLEVYQQGRDLHDEVTVAMYGQDFNREQRVMCKMFNFSYLYGGSEYSFAEESGLPIGIARKFVRDYNEVMPGLTKWKREQFAQAKRQGYVVSPFGRKRRFPLITNKNKDDVRKASAHAPTAGTASDLTQISLMRASKDGILVVITVHDSIGALAREAEAEDVARRLREHMIGTATEYFPQVPWVVDVDIRDRWSPLPEEIHGEAVRQTFR